MEITFTSITTAQKKHIIIIKNEFTINISDNIRMLIILLNHALYITNLAHAIFRIILLLISITMINLKNTTLLALRKPIFVSHRSPHDTLIPITPFVHLYLSGILCIHICIPTTKHALYTHMAWYQPFHPTTTHARV